MHVWIALLAAPRLYNHLPRQAIVRAGAELRKALLFEPEFPVSASNAPCAIHQKSVLQPHEHDSIAAEAPDVLDHMRRAVGAQWPERGVWDGEDPTLTMAVQWSSSLFAQSPQAVIASRDASLDNLASALKQCRGYNQEALQQVPPHAKSMTKLQNFAAIQCLCDAMEYPDYDLAYKVCTGFELAGVIEKSNVHRSIAPKADVHAATHPLQPAKWARRLIGSMRKRSAKLNADQLKDANECYAATCKEVEDGWAIGSEAGPGGMNLEELKSRFGETLPLRRFPHRRYPGANVRPVDDGKENGLNKLARMGETIACENADFPCRVARMFFALLGATAMHSGTDDLTKAYRQFATSQPQYSTVAVWNPNLKRVEFFVLKGMPFGAAAAVNQFNRVPKFVVMVCRCFFGIAVCHYYDDYCICEPAPLAAHAQYILRRVHELLGFRLDVGKHERAKFANPFLGVITDFTMAHITGEASVRTKPERRLKLTAALREVIAKRSLTPAQSASLRGKLYFTCCSVYGRVGRAALRSFTSHQYGKSNIPSASLVAACVFFIILLRRELPRTVQLLPSLSSALVVWSDAALERGVGRIGWVAYDPADNILLTSHWDVPAWLILSFVHPTHCIGQLEILAALMVYLTLPAVRTAERRIFHYVDNTSAVMSLFKGYSAKSDSSRLVHIFSILQARLRFDIWWEYVPSKANIGDMPSRLDWSLLRALGARWVPSAILTADQYLAPLASWLT